MPQKQKVVPYSARMVTRRLILTVLAASIGIIITSSFIGAGLDIIQNHPSPGHALFGLLYIAIGLFVIGAVAVWTVEAMRTTFTGQKIKTDE
jgi:hypothetical protein